MWERYQRTFKLTQFTILVMTAMIFFLSGRAPLPALMFFIMMQGFAFIGVAWATRLKRLMERSDSRLPLQTRSP
jgi:hypothetical protein